MAKRLRLIILVFLCINLQAKTQPVIFSVQAHQDDWQLFMSSKIVSDLTAGSKVVFITLTAGDASCGDCQYSPIGPYYLGRERGSVYSSKFAADLTSAPPTLDVPVATTVTVNGKTLTKYVYRNTVNYFFRLPDGNGDGSGFSATGNQSLQRLRGGQIAAMNVIGHTSIPPNSGPAAFTYTWCQLVATIRAIVNLEKITGQQAWVHSSSLVTAYNPGDHSDHIYSSTAVREAVAGGSPCNNTNLAWVGINAFANYASSGMAANLTVTEHQNASIIFGLCVLGITESEYQNDFNSSHQDWLPMDHYTQFRSPVGTAFWGGDPGNEEIEVSKNIVPDLPGPTLSSLAKIPMVVSITGPVFIDKDISMVISPYEPGQLTTSIHDMAGNKVYELTTKVTNREALYVTLPRAIKTKGVYVLNNVLNDKYLESLKIVVEK